MSYIHFTYMYLYISEIVQLDSQNNPCDKLYQHILQHESRDRMRQITMADDRYADFTVSFHCSFPTGFRE